jgi:uncharacterized protein
MKYSKHTIFSRIRGSENYFLVNPLAGSADILSPDEGRMLEGFLKGDALPEEFRSALTEQGYFADPVEEEKLYRNRYLDFIDSRDTDEVQLFFVPNYSCNFACTYCYQDEYTNPNQQASPELIDAFFRYITLEFAGRRKYLTVFGGEPLLESPAQKAIITYLLQKANEVNLEVCFVTNGYSLANYAPLLSTARIREIQVTLDGMAVMHDQRRFLKGGGATFERIVAGIDACLERDMPVNLRMVADQENIGELPALARFAIEKGWTANPLFKTHLGRNYELHHCQTSTEKLFSRVSLYEAVFEQVKQHPHILEFYKPAYSVARFLSENGSLPDPLFDACPACKTEWAFDYTGRIYSCTATVGKEGEALGTFYPEVTRIEESIRAWENRDVTTIPECSSCSMQLICGGGCGSIAKNRTGQVCSTDCRPVKELLELGFAAYPDTEA